MGIAAQKNVLSKSQYLKGQQCPKALWLYRYRKDIEIPEDKDREQRFAIGHNIGEIAKQYFLERGPAVEVQAAFWNVEEGARQTRSFLAEGEEIIFEATAIGENQRAYSRIDMLRKQNYGQVELIEVKAATKLKPYHLEDMAFQYHVFQSAGFSISACYMMLIDRNYVRQGELELDKLFQFCDISSDVLARQPKVLEQSAKLSDLLSHKQEPEIPTGPHCHKPFPCEYSPYCQALLYHRSGELFATPQFMDCEINERASEIQLKPKMLQGWLERLHYPLYFLDYESFQSSIPLFDGCRPYQNIPFQFSLHKLESEAAELEHFAFLHTEQSDPRLPLIQSLLQYCGDRGSILVYNQNFESSINAGLAQSFPEHKQALLKLNERMRDMFAPFQKHWLYSPLQNGSASLKAVLPAFSELSYEGLGIDNGLSAMNGYLSFMLGNGSADLHRDLLLYCQRDTMALVVLLRAMRKLLAN